MLLLSRITVAIVLSIVIHYVDGNQRIVHVSELINDNDDVFTSGDGSGDGNNVIEPLPDINGDVNSSLTCCVYGKCSCHSFYHALAKLTSNILINITTDVMLSSLIEKSGLENISIIGHNNPTVNCKNAGGIHFNFCYNFIIQGITWDGCGRKIDGNTKPGIKLNYFSNITIQNCSFQHSKGPAVALSEVSGDVNISHCKFVNNIHYRGHGAAIHYSSNNLTNNSQLVFTINNCNFTHNKDVKSVFYIVHAKKRKPEHNKNITISFYNSIFYDNRGVSVYAVNQKFYFLGKAIFQNNGSAATIYIKDYSTIVFNENSDVAFIHNVADIFTLSKDGIITLSNHSSVLFDKNSIVTFNDNRATYNDYKAVIYSFDNSHVIFTGNSKVTFNNNALHYVIHSRKNGSISFEGKSTTVFRNAAAGDVGAIYSYDHSSISFKGNSTTLFSNNVAGDGGAIYSIGHGYIYFEDNF